MNMHYLIKFVPVRNSAALAGQLWPMDFPEVTFGLWSAEDSAGARGSKPNVADTRGSQVRIDSQQEASASHRMCLSTDLLSVLVTWRLAFSGASDPRGSQVEATMSLVT